MIRRAADPGDSKKGPINAIKPVLKVPSHHGPDVMTVKPEIDINSMAVAVPTTLMHCHSIVAFLPEGHGLTTASVLELWKQHPRIIIMNGAETNITTTAEVMEYARDIGRKWGTSTKSSSGRTVSNSMETRCTTSKPFTRSPMSSPKTLMPSVR